MVMKTLGKGVVHNIEVVGAITASVSAFLWIITATLAGAPISTTHSITGAVVGVGLSYMFFGSQETLINYQRIRDNNN
jgi:PiT family inorganic phosphate transporter